MLKIECNLSTLEIYTNHGLLEYLCQNCTLQVVLSCKSLQHPEKGGASCLMPSGKPQDDKPSGSDDSESVLGLIPHSIRGSVHTYNQYMPATPAFSQCTGCSKPVIEAYAKE